MELVAEKGLSGLPHIEGDLNGGSMAFVAVPLDREAYTPVVAGTARFPLLHVGHFPTLVVRTGNEQFAVAVGAAVHLQVLVVAEARIVGHGDVPDRMALAAVPRDRESRLAIVAGAARLPLFHLRHTEAGASGAGQEDAIVTVVALEQQVVKAVAEQNLADVRDVEIHVMGALVAAVATA